MSCDLHEEGVVVGSDDCTLEPWAIILHNTAEHKTRKQNQQQVRVSSGRLESHPDAHADSHAAHNFETLLCDNQESIRCFCSFLQMGTVSSDYNHCVLNHEPQQVNESIAQGRATYDTDAKAARRPEDIDCASVRCEVARWVLSRHSALHGHTAHRDLQRKKQDPTGPKA